MSKIILTGGAGFIGSCLARELISQGHNVSIVDDLSTGKKENVPEGCLFFQNDICDIKSLEQIFAVVKPEIVFHVAAKPRVQFSIQYPQLTNESNITGTLNMLVAAKKYNVKRFIYSSSSSIYGDQDTLPFVETMRPNPMSPYALQKYVGECYCNLYNKIYGLETVNLRYFNVYGPGMDPGGSCACAIAKFIIQSKNSEPFTVWGDGRQRRSNCFISDVVRANILAAFSDDKNIIGKAFNIGSETNQSVIEIIEMIKKLAKKNLTEIHLPPVIEPRETLANTELAKQLLNWQPEVLFEDGLKRTYDYFVKEK